MAIKKSNFACVYMRNISQYDSGERCGPWASCFLKEGDSPSPRGDNSEKVKIHRIYQKNLLQN
jgi:hypothetical protein